MLIVMMKIQKIRNKTMETSSNARLVVASKPATGAAYSTLKTMIPTNDNMPTKQSKQQRTRMSDPTPSMPRADIAPIAKEMGTLTLTNEDAQPEACAACFSGAHDLFLEKFLTGL